MNHVGDGPVAVDESTIKLFKALLHNDGSLTFNSRIALHCFAFEYVSSTRGLVRGAANCCVSSTAGEIGRPVS